MSQGKTALPSLIHGDETGDTLPGSDLRIIQKKRGYRFSIDACLLAHFVGPGRGRHILDLGTGSGVIALLLRRLRPGSRIVGVEIQGELADMARRTLVLNGIGDEVSILEGDLRKIKDLLPARSFDIVVANPPYRSRDSGRVNPDDQKARARHEITGCLEDFLQAAAYSLKPGGCAYFVYPVRRMVELICRMHQNRLEPKRCRIVHSFQEKRGEFLLVQGVAGGRGELAVDPPFILYEEIHVYSGAAKALFNDLASSAGNGDDRFHSS